MIYKPEAIIFDWDNTLVDSLPAVEHARGVAFEKFKKYCNSEPVLTSVNSPKSLFFMQFGDKANDAIEFFLSEYESIAKSIKPFDDAEDVLEMIAAYDIPTMIVSNKINRLLNKEVVSLNWDKYFRKVVGSQDTPQDKPNPDPVYLALEAVSMKPSNKVWLIGDSTIDVQCAFNSGCHPILFGDKEEFDQNEFPNITVDHVETHSELKKMLLSIV